MKPLTTLSTSCLLAFAMDGAARAEVVVTKGDGICDASEFQVAVAALPKAEYAHETLEVAVVQVSSPLSADTAVKNTTLLYLGEKLSRGSKYVMSGHYLTFQRDGNLCVYTQAGDRFVWCVNDDSTVKYQDAYSAELSREGQLVLRDIRGTALWAVPNDPQPNTVVHIHSDGTLELMSNGTSVWKSKN